MNNENKKREENIWTLDFLPRGHPEDDRPSYKKDALIQGIGEDYFMLLEAVPKEDKTVSQYDKLYIGSGERDIVDHVKRRIGYSDLTHSAQIELPYVLEEIIKDKEDKFVKFFNDAQPVTTRQHMLELLPGIGKKLMWNILDERDKKDFDSFKDLSERVGGVHNPEKVIAKRIMEEIKGEDIKYHLFLEKD
ncbi:MAG: putative RNA-binding protein [Candidatus Methanohalarchaeum thermophilum]|uniref:RNA-binding protein n=1 Tax=Methanohalarchaeum thermophilum TaxID=1903181 RepID=A0A1Q6DXX9_METT1|nr:MAG: putative RNA-binding protein [Candidatus Methanohalarchaeum thermophilum]